MQISQLLQFLSLTAAASAVTEQSKQAELTNRCLSPYSGLRHRVRQRRPVPRRRDVLGRVERPEDAVRMADAGPDPSVSLHRRRGGGRPMELS
ncbi:hypothetical protein DL767_005012 [Monosporascus sp. MG133]|nr:hypothetical protein DL767_005012 [Monosporascus sp. MG133]